MFGPTEALIGYPDEFWIQLTSSDDEYYAKFDYNDNNDESGQVRWTISYEDEVSYDDADDGYVSYSGLYMVGGLLTIAAMLVGFNFLIGKKRIVQI